FYGLKKHANKKWNILSNKENDYYVPVLDAFTIEMKNIINYDPKIIYNLFEYLLGHHDFYKIMKYKESNTVIQAFNQNRSLNRSITTSMPKYRIKKLFFPKKLINIERINKNTVIITFEHGWQISFRIHNASSKIEPSLKFDIRFVGIPVQLHQHVAVW
ncbi:MAG: HaeIII family restriction endonuclease, partial [Nitrosopumilus sp. H8]